MDGFSKEVMFGIVDVLTLLRTSAVGTGTSVGRVLGVTGGSTVPCPIKIIIFVLGEHADRLFLKTAVELPW